MSSRQYRNRQSETSAAKSGQSLFAFLICHALLSRVRVRLVLGAASHHTDPHGASRPGASKCLTSSCWPSGSASSRCRSATRSPAIDSEEAFMMFDYSLAGLVTVGLMIYLTYALLKPERL